MKTSYPWYVSSFLQSWKEIFENSYKIAVVWIVKVKIWKLRQKAEKAPRRYQNSAPQRVLNDLWKTRLSRRRMIWLLSSHVSKLDRRRTCRKTEEERQLADGKVAEEPNHTTARKPGPP
jgi:hypothetical protein